MSAKNAPVTRNVRLAAIKSFFRFLEYRQPAALEHIRRVLAIPFKKTDQRLVPYLLREELQAVLDAPDPATRDGVRDHDLQLGEADVTGVGLAPRRPMGAKDVGDLQGRPRHAALVRRAAFGSRDRRRADRAGS